MPKRRWSPVFGLGFALLLITLLTQACNKKPLDPQASCNFVMNSEEQRVSWGTRLPVSMYVHSSVPKEYFDSIVEAAKEWNLRSKREMIQIAGWTNGPLAPAQDGGNVIYFMDTWESDRSREQGRTTIYWAGDTIYEADIRINARDFRFFVGPVPEPGKVDFQSLVVHEMGHVFGLAHNETSGSVMPKTLSYASMRREVGGPDIASIKCEY